MNLKHITLAATILLAKPAFAYVSCAGETYSGKIVEVVIETEGSMAQASRGLINITEANGTVTSYELKKEEIVQFFEAVDDKRAIVGVAAYQSFNNPIWIKYVGENYEGDLLKVLRDPSRKKIEHNEMRVWRGPGYGPDQQSQFTDVVCNISLDI